MNKIFYIVGNIPQKIDEICIDNFKKVELELIKMGFQTINPINQYLNNLVDREEAEFINLNHLIDSDYIYVLDESCLFNVNDNLEMKIALQLNIGIVWNMF